MSVDLQVDQALILKKRARRRLVGAIALVLLMLIILPQVLQDRSAQTAPSTIKITMPESEQVQVSEENNALEPTSNPSLAEPQQAIEDTPALIQVEPEVTPTPDAVAALKEAEAKELEQKKSLVKSPEIKVNSVPAPKADAKKVEPIAAKPAEKPQEISAKAGEDKPSPNQEGNFTVQVGVYSDVANVKRLQNQLKEAGFVTSTEKTATPKGDGLRLKAGKFKSREDAMNALTKIKEIGLPGIVISND